MNSNELNLLSLQNPFYLDHHRLTKTLGINVITAPTLLTFAQLQNFYTYTALSKGWDTYFWSHMDVIALPDERQDPYTSLYHRAVEVLRESKTMGKWAARWFAYDRLSLVNTQAYVDMGGWDTMIPFYIGDCDMHERLWMEDYIIKDAFVGYIYDVGRTFDDIRILYRENNATLTESLCAEDAPDVQRPYGLADCRFEGLIRTLDDWQRAKIDHEGGRNYWQIKQVGGQGEPFYRDPEGFDRAIGMTIEHGKNVFAEKWGHRDCNLREVGLKTNDAWRVEHDW